MFLLTDDPDAPQSLHYRNDVTAHVVFKEVIQCSRMLFVTITLQMIWKKLRLENIIKSHYCWQAIPIKNPMVLSKIHQTYRIGYLKVQSHELFWKHFILQKMSHFSHFLQDVILSRVVDDATATSLDSIINANKAAVSRPNKHYLI